MIQDTSKLEKNNSKENKVLNLKSNCLKKTIAPMVWYLQRHTRLDWVSNSCSCSNRCLWNLCHRTQQVKVSVQRLNLLIESQKSTDSTESNQQCHSGIQDLKNQERKSLVSKISLRRGPFSSFYLPWLATSLTHSPSNTIEVQAGFIVFTSHRCLPLLFLGKTTDFSFPAR